MYACDDWPAQVPMSALENSVSHADLFDLCAAMPDASVDMIAADLPYATTQNVWDVLIPLEPMWSAFKRIIKKNGVIALTCNQPFTSDLIVSNRGMYHEELIWNKVLAVGFLDANRKHLKQHETVLIFCDGMPTYNPQMSKGNPYTRPPKKQTSSYGAFKELAGNNLTGDRYPKSIINISNADRTDTVHPTQKPVSLFSYLIRTYTQPGELVFDPCTGSGTTAIAAREEGRRFVCGDSSLEYVAVARNRLAMPYTPSFMPALEAAS
jgi:site-specific DNA-methyltransferase (adenine-specific)